MRRPRPERVIKPNDLLHVSIVGPRGGKVERTVTARQLGQWVQRALGRGGTVDRIAAAPPRCECRWCVQWRRHDEASRRPAIGLVK